MKKKLFTLVALLAAAMAFAAPVDGDWNVTLTAPEGSTSFTMTVETEGETALGRAGDATFNGTYKEGKLELVGPFYVMEAGYEAELTMDIRMEGNQLAGKAYWDVYAAEVIGKRPQ